MDNAQKAIMIGVGLFITIIIISAVLLIVNLGTGLVDDATANLSSISSTLQSQILQNYDAKLLSGTQVRSAMNQYMTSSEIGLVLCKGNTTGEATLTTNAVAWTGAECYIADKISITGGKANLATGNVPTTNADKYNNSKIGSLSELSNPSIDKYINTSARYYSFIIYNSNDAMVGIIFVPEKATGTAGAGATLTANALSLS